MFFPVGIFLFMLLGSPCKNSGYYYSTFRYQSSLFQLARLRSCWERFGRVSKLYKNWVGQLVGGVGNEGVLGGLDGQVPGVVHGVLGQRDGREVDGDVYVGGVRLGRFL